MKHSGRDITVTPDVLFDMERELAEPLFNGVPIGSTMGDVFVVNLLHGHYDLGMKNVVRDLVGCARHFFKGTVTRQKDVSALRGKVMFTWLIDKPSLRNLVLPVISGMGAHRCLVFGPNSQMKSHLPDGAELLTWDEAPSVDMSRWRREFIASGRTWLRKLVGFCRRHQLPYRVLPLLLKYLMVQSQRVAAYGRLLDQLAPLGVVTEYDRNLVASCLVLSANWRNIPTITMMHGVINPPYGYTPVLANYLFCWGESQRRQLIDLGAAPEKLKATGAQHISRTIAADRLTERNKLAISDDRPLVLLATNPISARHRKELVRFFCEGLALSGFHLVVRLHPAEQLEFYVEEIASFPQVRFTTNHDMTLDESMAALDIVCCHDSGFGLDAIIKGKPVLVLDVLDIPLKGGKELVERAKCPRICQKDELLDEVRRISESHEYRHRLQEKAKGYVTDNFLAFDDNATRNVVDSITGILHLKVHNNSYGAGDTVCLSP